MVENIDEILLAFRQKGEASLKKEVSEYNSFQEFEADCCSIINEGNSICRTILQNPDCCDKLTYLSVSSGFENYTDSLGEKFKCLVLIRLFINKLFNEYNKILAQYLEKDDDMQVINLYEQMYNLSKDYVYRKKIADLLYQKYKNFKQAMEIYQQIESVVAVDDVEYWSNYAELNAEYENYKKRDYCLERKQLAQHKSEINAALTSKDYKKAIKKYEDLFKLTNDYTYKKEIANIYAVCMDEVSKAIKIYSELEPHLGNDANYWFQFSELYGKKENLYRQVLCIQKAINIELKEPEGSV